MPEMDEHYNVLIKAIKKGRVIPFLGAGINLCGRPVGTKWKKGQSIFLPSGSELAKYLADENDYPAKEKQDLLRVSQYISVMNGTGPLYEDLHDLFDKEYPPTDVHQFLSNLPSIFREKGYPPKYQLIVTTNYDDVLERSFKNADEPYDLVWYATEGEKRGKFWHNSADDGTVSLVEKPNEYLDLSLEERTVILKIHGAIDRTKPDRDSFVITEDHYIDYLTRTDLSNLIPVKLAAKLRKSHFLFLGYSLCDWNLRVILQRIWGECPLTYTSWAIQKDPDELDRKFWKKRGETIEILNMCLEDYITGLVTKINELPVSSDTE